MQPRKLRIKGKILDRKNYEGELNKHFMQNPEI